MSFNDGMDIDRDQQQLPQSAFQQNTVQERRPVQPNDFDDLANRLEGFGNDGGETSRTKGKTPVRDPSHRLTPTTGDTQDDDDDSDDDSLDLSKWTGEYVRACPYKLPKLNDDNWRTWSRSIEKFLSSRRLWGIVDGTVPKPVRPKRHAKIWQQYDDYITGLMMDVSTPSQQSYISLDDYSGKSMYDTWANVHTNKGQLRIPSLFMRMCTLKAEKDDTVDKVHSELRRINDVIGSIDPGSKSNDRFIGMFLMNVYNGNQKYHMALYHLNNDNAITAQKVVSELKTIEQSQKDRAPSRTIQQARIGEESSNNNGNQRNSGCYRCNEKGHIARNCRAALDDDGKVVEKHEKPGSDGRQDRSSQQKKSSQKPTGKGKTGGKNRNNAAVADEGEENASDFDDESAIAIDSDSALMATDESENVRSLASDDITDSTWTIDSGATRHMTTDRQSFVSFKDTPTGIRVGGKKTLRSPGRGDIEVTINGKNTLMRDVLWVPDLGYNLLSISALERRKCEINFVAGKVNITRRGTLIACGIRRGNLYHLASIMTHSALVSSEEVEALEIEGDEAPEVRPPYEGEGTPYNSDIGEVSEPTLDEYRLAHIRWGHPGRRRMEALATHVYGFAKVKEPDGFFCDVCENNKAIRRIKRYRLDREIKPGGRIFFDVWGPYRVRTPVPGLNPDPYFQSAIDEATSHSWINPIPDRKGVAKGVIVLLNRLDRREEGIVVRYCRFDNALEFKSLENALTSKGIVVEYTTAYTPEENAMAERLNRTIIQMVRCMLEYADLPDGFWPEAAIYANYLKNLLPMSEGDSPYEKWEGRKPLTGTEKTFGMLCKVTYAEEVRKPMGKLFPTAFDGIYMGTVSSSQSRVYNPRHGRVEVHTNVKVFDERKATHLLKDLISSTTPAAATAPMTLIDPSQKHFEGEETVTGEGITTITNTVTRPRNEATTNIEKVGDNNEEVQEIGPGDHQNKSTTPGFPQITDQRENSAPEGAERNQGSEFPSQPNEVPRLPNKFGEPGSTTSVPEGAEFEKGAEGDQGPEFPGQSDEIPQSPNKSGEPGSTNAVTPQELPPTDDMDIDPDIDTDNEMVDADARPQREHHRYDPYSFDNTFGGSALITIGGSAYIATANPDPITFKQAMNAPDSFRWKEGVSLEFIHLATNNVFELVDIKDIPPGQKLIDSKWVFKKKFLPSGLIDKYKARLVGRGFTQAYGIDYEETFAPTLRFESLRILFAIAITYGLRLWLLDVIAAYLNGDIDANIYMKLPEGYPRTAANKNKVWHLLKGLYGLKQSGRLWARKFRKEITKFDFKPITADTCIFKKTFKDGEVCLIALYVDDIIIATKRTATFKRVKQMIESAFKVTDSGLLTGVLGVRVNQTPDRITIDQAHYIETLLEKHGMSDCKPVDTPIAGYTGILPADDNEPRADQREYQQVVGGIMFANIATRPDLAFAISKLSQFCHDPTIRHHNALFRVLKYLKGTANHGLVFVKGLKPQYYSDAAFADNSVDKRTTAGFLMMNAGAACVWYSRKQRIVVTSTVEAEYVALAEGSKSAIWADRWMNEIGFITESPITLLGDNNGSISLTKNPENHARTKHIDVRYHFIREKVEEGLICVQYVNTKDQLADGMTKPLDRPRFEQMRARLGLHPIV